MDEVLRENTIIPSLPWPPSLCFPTVTSPHLSTNSAFGGFLGGVVALGLHDRMAVQARGSEGRKFNSRGERPLSR
ncbi:MAG: hypothetical protein JNM66_23770 [Bryobacterales bacterium]|nr:hypothetical protein [Bryobacterales bacterium]